MSKVTTEPGSDTGTQQSHREHNQVWGGGAVGCRHFRNMGYCGVTDFLCSGKTRTVMFGVPSYCLGSTNTEMGSGELAKTPQNDVKYPCSGPGPN